jgi:hypothetical protein
MHVFVDTEFTDFIDCELVSIGSSPMTDASSTANDRITIDPAAVISPARQYNRG